jgi:hypothetical protein
MSALALLGLLGLALLIPVFTNDDDYTDTVEPPVEPP